MIIMSGNHRKYVLVGGGPASSAAAQAIRRRDPEGSMLLIGQEVNRPYFRPALSRDYLLGRQDREQLFTLSDRWFVQKVVELRTARRASSLDVARHSVMLDDGEEIIFDKLLIATGASPRPLSVPGAEMPNVCYLRTLADAERLQKVVERARREGRRHEHGRGQVVMVGAGLLGVELASALTQRGLALQMVFAGEYPWHRIVGQTAGRLIWRRLESRGVKLHAQSTPLRLEGDGRVQRVVLPAGPPIECDLVVAALGAVPHRELIRGTAISAEKAILVDERCRTSHSDIFAAGDCAAIFDPLFGRYRVLDHWPSAIETGKIAGANMAGGDERFDGVAGFTSRAFDLGLVVWGDETPIERRIVRGNPNPESPDLVELGVAGDGRICFALAINRGEDQTLRELVGRAVNVRDRADLLRDPATDLRVFLQ